MNKSIQLHRQKAKARMRLRRRLAKGEVRLDQTSVAASALSCTPESPLILTKVKVPETD